MKISVEEASNLIFEKEIVAIPTDTVYGLAVLPECEERLFWFKGRPENKKFILLAANTEQVIEIVGEIEGLRALADEVWPGATTLILPYREGTLGFRVPDHPEACELLSRTGPLPVTSANLHDEPPATSDEQIINYFGPEFPVLQGREPSVGEPSRIIDFTTQAVLRR